MAVPVVPGVCAWGLVVVAAVVVALLGSLDAGFGLKGRVLQNSRTLAADDDEVCHHIARIGLPL